jgi:hypothetical protein
LKSKKKKNDVGHVLRKEFVALGQTANKEYKQKNSVAFSPQANYTERSPLVGEVSVNFCE